MNRCDDCVERLYVTNSVEEVRSSTHGQLMKDLLRAKGQ